MSKNVVDNFSIEKIVKSIIYYSKNKQVMEVLNKAGYDIVPYNPENKKQHNNSIVLEFFKKPDEKKIEAEIFDDVKKRWQDILKEFKRISPKQYDYLKTVEPIKVENNKIYLTFPAKYEKIRNRIQNNTANFEKAIENIIKMHLSIVYN